MKKLGISFAVLWLLLGSVLVAQASPCTECMDYCDTIYFDQVAGAYHTYQQCIRSGIGYDVCDRDYQRRLMELELQNSDCTYNFCASACGHGGEPGGPGEVVFPPFDPNPPPGPKKFSQVCDPLTSCEN